MNAWCSLWLLALALAESGLRFLCVDLLCVAVLCAALCDVECVVLLAVECECDAVAEECFLCVEDAEPDDDEFPCDQHAADNAPARTSAATLLQAEKT